MFMFRSCFCSSSYRTEDDTKRLEQALYSQGPCTHELWTNSRGLGCGSQDYSAYSRPFVSSSVFALVLSVIYQSKSKHLRSAVTSLSNLDTPII